MLVVRSRRCWGYFLPDSPAPSPLAGTVGVAVTNEVHDVGLHMRFGEHGGDGFGEAFEPIDDGDDHTTTHRSLTLGPWLMVFLTGSPCFNAR